MDATEGCRGGTCDRVGICENAGKCTYRSSADEAREHMAKTLNEKVNAKPVLLETPVQNRQKGKQDFTGEIDGNGYKQSFDNPEKPPVDLVWPGFVLGIGRVLGKGATKYARGNWMRGMSWTGVMAAVLRHSYAIICGEDYDKESGELHLYHIGCEIMFLAWFVDGERKAEYKHFDDRLFNKK